MSSYNSRAVTCGRTDHVTSPNLSPAPALSPERPGMSTGRWSGYRHLLAARLKELAREPEVVFWIFIFPLLLAFGLGIAFRNKPPDVSRVAIEAAPSAAHTVELLKDAQTRGSIQAEILPGAEAENRFRYGKFDLVIVPKPDGSFEYLYDPARPESNLARYAVNDALQSGAGRTDPLTASTKVSSAPGSRYIDFLIPGLLGMNLMGSGMWGVGFALVDMRQRKLLKRYLATPMRRGDFLLAVASSRLVLMLIELLLLLSFGILAFHMHVAGSWFTILLISTIGAFAFGGLGLLTASRAQKIETASGLINLVMMPMWIFSGVFFSYERFPALVQPIIRLLPLTALNDALRATITEGASLTAQSGRLMILCLWGAISFVLAVRWFRWT
jgi:ABC-2 type transport system permease protein